MDKDKLRSEIDINIAENRVNYWQKNLDEETKRLLEMDNSYFLHQSLSTPCLNVMKDRALGIIPMRKIRFLLQ